MVGCFEGCGFFCFFALLFGPLKDFQISSKENKNQQMKAHPISGFQP